MVRRLPGWGIRHTRLWRLQKVPALFASLKPRWKIFLFSGFTVYLFFRLFLFYRAVLLPKLNAFAALFHKWGDVFKKIDFLIHFDVLVLIGLSVGVVFVCALIFGRPEKPGRLLFCLKGRPVFAFIAGAIGFGAILILTPTLLANTLLSFYDEQTFLTAWHSLHPAYRNQALWLTLCLALSLSDIAAKPGVFRWWAYLILILPPMRVFPLLWWNALAGLFPSRYWTFWRPVLAFASCLVPILVLPQAQPIREGIPRYETAPRQTLFDCVGYQAEALPGKDQLFTRCSDPAPGLARYEQGIGDPWRKTNTLKQTGFIWNRGTLDLKRNQVYIVDGNTRILHVYSYPDFAPVAQVPIATNAFPVRSFNILQAMDKKRGLLFIAENEGYLISINLDDFSIGTVRFFSWGDRIRDLEFCDETDELLVLQSRRLCAVAPTDFNVVRTRSFAADAYDLLIDPKKDQVLISFPQRMEVGVFSRGDFGLAEILDGPAGVRTLALDEQRRLYFLGSISGVLEVVDADLKTRKARVRIAPWIHWIEPVPKAGQAMVTMGDVPAVIWQYDPMQTAFDPFDRTMEFAEKAMRFILANARRENESEPNLDARPPDFIGKENIILFTSLDSYSGATQNEDVGYHLRIIHDAHQLKAAIKKPGKDVDMVILDLPQSTHMSLAIELTDWIKKASPGIRVFFRETNE